MIRSRNPLLYGMGACKGGKLTPKSKSDRWAGLHSLCQPIWALIPCEGEESLCEDTWYRGYMVQPVQRSNRCMREISVRTHNSPSARNYSVFYKKGSLREFIWSCLTAGAYDSSQSRAICVRQTILPVWSAVCRFTSRTGSPFKPTRREGIPTRTWHGPVWAGVLRYTKPEDYLVANTYERKGREREPRWPPENKKASINWLMAERAWLIIPIGHEKQVLMQVWEQTAYIPVMCSISNRMQGCICLVSCHTNLIF